MSNPGSARHRKCVMERPESRSTTSSQPLHQQRRRVRAWRANLRTGGHAPPSCSKRCGQRLSSKTIIVQSDRISRQPRGPPCEGAMNAAVLHDPRETSSNTNKLSLSQRGLRTPGLDQETQSTAQNVTGSHVASNSFTGLFSPLPMPAARTCDGADLSTQGTTFCTKH